MTLRHEAPRRRIHPSRHRATRTTAPIGLGVLAALLLMVAAAVGGQVLAWPWTHLPVAAIAAAQETSTEAAGDALGAGRADPVPFGEAVAAGPLELRVVDALAGPPAVEAVAAAAPQNVGPGDGATYVLVRLAVRNVGDVPRAVSNNDFALTGASGVVERFLDARPPDPVLNATLAPGDETDGWVVFAVAADERDLLLLFDSLGLPGVWADRTLAIESGAAVANDAARVAEPNVAGVDPAAPVGIGEAIVTEQWQVELLETVTGADVFPLVDYRTGALGDADAVGGDADGSIWVALRVRVTNVAAGGEAAFLPANAFKIVDAAGQPFPDLTTLTPPRPDASGAYYPSGSRDGWVAFDVPPAAQTGLVRFLPYAETTTAPDPRYLAYG